MSDGQTDRPDERTERDGAAAPEDHRSQGGAAAPEAAPEAPLPGVSGAGIEIIVDADGNVIFTDLPPELQAIVDELDPDSPRSTVCLVPPADAPPADAPPADLPPVSEE